MQKYFSSTHNSGIVSSKNLVSFKSMLNLSPKVKASNSTRNYKDFELKGFTSRNAGTQKELNKTAENFSYVDRTSFKSLEKKTPIEPRQRSNISEWKPKSTTTFLKKKQFPSIKQISICNPKKDLRQTDSTQCQSPKSHLNFGPKISDFKKLRLIGHGKYGSVFMVKHLRSGFIGAMKIIRKIDIDCLPKPEKQQMINQLIREIKIQMFLEHPNLIKLYTYFSDNYNIYLLLELGCDGMLYDLMKKKQKFQEESVSILSREILEGTAYMHRHEIIHRDIKPENIVMVHGLAKICDFGWSVKCSKNNKDLRSTFCGTPLYLSPEILKGQQYDEKIDVWAIGTLAHELLTGDNPFRILKKEDLAKIITEDFMPKSGSYEFKDFVSMILRKDPKKRPEAKTMRTHKFINKFRDLETSEEICSLIYKKEVSVYRSYYK